MPQERAPDSTAYNNWDKFFYHYCLEQPFLSPLQLKPFTMEEAGAAPCTCLKGQNGYRLLWLKEASPIPFVQEEMSPIEIRFELFVQAGEVV